jgi:hypothetical protein
MGRQKFNKRQSWSLHILGEGLSVLLIRVDDTVQSPNESLLNAYLLQSSSTVPPILSQPR